MLNAMNKGITGLQNFQKNIEVIGTNLSNVNTPGHKARRVIFQETAGRSPAGGSAAGHVETLMTPGQVTATGVPTDFAVQGQGFFVVGAAGQQRFTRDGSFQLDADGYLVSRSGGLRLQGYGARDGAVDTAAGLKDLRIPLGRASRAQGSGRLAVTGNLDASAAPYAPASGGQPEKGGVARIRTTVMDSLGKSHEVTLVLKSLGSRKWSWEVQPGSGPSDLMEGATGTVEFDSQGKAVSTDLSFAFRPEGSEAQTVTLDVSALTQLAGATNANAKADGFAPGELQSFSVDSEGVVTGVYSSGLREVLGRVALATFRNPASLDAVGENLLAATADSGAATISPAGASAGGAILAGNLEGSNVDVSTELTRMVLTQRAFQSNSRLIRVADEMWQDVLDLGR